MVNSEFGRSHPQADLIVAGARACVGSRFRPQGRGPGGFDCLGVVLAAAFCAGIRLHPRSDYALGSCPAGEVLLGLADLGCRILAVSPSPGDLAVSVPAPGHVHFAVLTDIGLVEAHAGLRRVIERRMAADDIWHSIWRLPLEGF